MAKKRTVDDDNATWFSRHRVKYQFTAETKPNVKAEDIDRATYGHFIRAPFPNEGVVRWGFLTAQARDRFCKTFKGKST